MCSTLSSSLHRNLIIKAWMLYICTLQSTTVLCVQYYIAINSTIQYFYASGIGLYNKCIYSAKSNRVKWHGRVKDEPCAPVECSSVFTVPTT